MKHFKRLCICLITLISTTVTFAESSYDIAGFYAVTKPEPGTKAVGKSDRTIEVEYILTPTNVDKGKYVTKVKKIGDNLYLIKDADICVETRYCHEWSSFSEEVVLIIESNYGYTKGKIIFD